jgi:hypothetical protein
MNLTQVQEGVTFAASEEDMERCIYRLKAVVTYNVMISQDRKAVHILERKKKNRTIKRNLFTGGVRIERSEHFYLKF